MRDRRTIRHNRYYCLVFFLTPCHVHGDNGVGTPNTEILWKWSATVRFSFAGRVHNELRKKFVHHFPYAVRTRINENEPDRASRVSHHSRTFNANARFKRNSNFLRAHTGKTEFRFFARSESEGFVREAARSPRFGGRDRVRRFFNDFSILKTERRRRTVRDVERRRTRSSRAPLPARWIATEPDGSRTSLWFSRPPGRRPP